ALYAGQAEIHGVDASINSSGAALVAWDEDGDASGVVWVAWFQAGQWGPAEKVSDGSDHAILPRIALNDLRAAVVAFEVVEYQGSADINSTIWARRWSGGTWGSAERLSDAPAAPNDLYASRPRVAIDGAGNAVVSWDQQKPSSGFPEAVYASRF